MVQGCWTPSLAFLVAQASVWTLSLAFLVAQGCWTPLAFLVAQASVWTPLAFLVAEGCWTLLAFSGRSRLLDSLAFFWLLQAAGLAGFFLVAKAADMDREERRRAAKKAKKVAYKDNVKRRKEEERASLEALQATAKTAPAPPASSSAAGGPDDEPRDARSRREFKRAQADKAARELAEARVQQLEEEAASQWADEINQSMAAKTSFDLQHAVITSQANLIRLRQSQVASSESKASDAASAAAGAEARAVNAEAKIAAAEERAVNAEAKIAAAEARAVRAEAKIAAAEERAVAAEAKIAAVNSAADAANARAGSAERSSAMWHQSQQAALVQVADLRKQLDAESLGFFRQFFPPWFCNQTRQFASLNNSHDASSLRKAASSSEALRLNSERTKERGRVIALEARTYHSRGSGCIIRGLWSL